MPRELLAMLLVVCFLGRSTGARAAGAADGPANRPANNEMLPAEFQKLLPLHKPLGKPQPGDWLAEHPEKGQTFRQYVESRPVVPDRRRRVIYVQPLGEFTDTQRKIVTLTAEFLQIYFGLPVKTRPDLSLDLIPAEARRKHPSWGMDQILSTYVLYQVLYPRVPRDATAYIALTPSDLWPGEGWNFVFGQASLTHRVGVWSIYRNGDPEENDDAFRLCLVRTIKTATHETGHMLSMAHCTRYECNMCGSNHRAESDRRPLWLCPQCLAKLCWATKVDPEQRFEKLIAFCEANGLSKEREFFEKSLAALRER
jgi:archaemetzincin